MTVKLSSGDTACSGAVGQNLQIEQSLLGFPYDRIPLHLRVRPYDRMLSICGSCVDVHNVNWSEVQYLRTCGAGFPGPHLRPSGVHECNERRSGCSNPLVRILYFRKCPS